MGTMLEQKLIVPFVTGPAKHGALLKPVLVLIITDGEPRGESPGSQIDRLPYPKVQEHIKYQLSSAQISISSFLSAKKWIQQASNVQYRLSITLTSSWSTFGIQDTKPKPTLLIWVATKMHMVWRGAFWCCSLSHQVCKEGLEQFKIWPWSCGLPICTGAASDLTYGMHALCLKHELLWSYATAYAGFSQAWLAPFWPAAS